ncbi:MULTISPECIES: hypothetical protein [unclassified Shinella]|uniref:hypothetical protein n=1 Tax=unclassified Shinella TaxID=2643062 RepID=UPI00234F5D34|nr:MULTISPECIES: hypothetical protein [unclassified Shinella]MDC7266802.1 phospholipase [Shinella sp. HY16]MDC7273699.1 phospholipase [Shinella sp. YZ44]
MTRNFHCRACQHNLFDCTCECSSTFVAGAEQLSQFLAFCLRGAKHEVIISSPWITGGALATMWTELMGATRRAEIHFYTDYEFNLMQVDKNCKVEDLFETYKRSFAEGIRMLRDLGVTVHRLRGAHNKSLIVDERIFVDGSFNWLSAWRDPKSELTRHDSAVAICGRRATRHRMQYLEQQFNVPLEMEPILLDRDDEDALTYDFLNLTSEGNRFFTGRDEPTYTTDVALPVGQPLFFSILEEFSGVMLKRGIDRQVLDRNDNSIRLVRDRDAAIDHACVSWGDEVLVEDANSFAIFEVDRAQLKNLHLFGSFGRTHRRSDYRTPLQTRDIIPPQALRRDRTTYVQQG